jgi:hypothetical protein
VTTIVGKRLFFSIADRIKECGKCGLRKKLSHFRVNRFAIRVKGYQEWDSGHYISWCKVCESERGKEKLRSKTCG